MRKTICLVVAASTAVVAAVPAETKVRANRAADEVARAFVVNKFIREADFPVLPPDGNPVGTSKRNIAKFPRNGSHFAVLSTGDATKAPRRNKSEMTSANNNGPALRGTRDLVMMRVKLKVPNDRNCLRFGFKFLSEEFPEFVDSDFNDAFIADLDKTTWDSKRNSPVVESPHNFALDSRGNPIRVNTVGNAVVKRRFAKGSTYDAATRTLRASTPVTPGKHDLYLSIFDQGDRQYDSSVFIDAVRVVNRKNCKTGVVVDR